MIAPTPNNTKAIAPTFTTVAIANITKISPCLFFLPEGFNLSVTHQPEISQLVRETRKRLKLIQTAFALNLGVSYQSVNPWENRKNQPIPLAANKLVRNQERF